MSVEIINKNTTNFPAGGAAVEIREGVRVIRGLDYGPVAGRGVAIIVENGNGIEVKPEGATIFQTSIPEEQKPITRSVRPVPTF